MAKRKAARSTKAAVKGRGKGASKRPVTRPKAAGKAAKSARKARAKAAARKPARAASAAKPAKNARAAKPASRKTAAARGRSPRTVGQGSAASGTARGNRPVNRGPFKTTKPLGPAPSPGRTVKTKLPKLDRVRRTLEETVPTPPSSLDMKRQGSSARSGRAELANSLEEHGGISPTITAGDVDADYENAYFSGDEAPGGDNPTPDQEVVEDIGKALGVEYQDNEELRASDKVVERDKHRWELDPASAEDYKERK